MSDKQLSPNKKALKRFFKNRVAVAGLLVIVLSLLMAIFAYALAPDHTHNADEQVLQLKMHSPGFSTDMLKIKRDKPEQHQNLLQVLFDGSYSQYDWVPINSYRLEGHDIVAKVYRGKNYTAEEKRWPMVDVLFARSLTNDSVAYSGNTVSYFNLDNKYVSTTLEAMTAELKQKNIVHKTFFLGTDKFGRDILSRMILGVRVSLTVGLVSALISMIIGLILGSLAGFFGGKVDDVVMWFITVFWSIPTFLLALGLALSVEGSKYLMIYVAVGLTMWVEMARMVRQQIMSIRKKEYIEAAEGLGYSHLRTIVVHILPNIIGPVIVVMASDFAGAILIEAGLSFLGLGVQPPKPSWGQMLNEYRDFLDTDKAYLTIIPGLAIMLMVLAFNLIGNGLRDAMDVRTKLSN
jgi:peptide/nickel transport system permease protein